MHAGLPNYCCVRVFECATPAKNRTWPMIPMIQTQHGHHSPDNHNKKLFNNSGGKCEKKDDREPLSHHNPLDIHLHTEYYSGYFSGFVLLPPYIFSLFSGCVLHNKMWNVGLTDHKLYHGVGWCVYAVCVCGRHSVLSCYSIVPSIAYTEFVTAPNIWYGYESRTETE